MAETGHRAFELLKQLLDQKMKLRKAYRQIPFLIPLSAQHTGSTPCQELYALIPSLISQHNTKVSILPVGFRPLISMTAVHLSWCTAILKSKPMPVQNRYLNAILQAEHQFSNFLLNASDAAQYAIKHGRSGAPVIIADVQDNPGAGGSSDTTELMKALAEQSAQQAVLGCLWDADAAQRAHTVGIGKTLELSLGGKSGPKNESPLLGSFTVAALSNGKFICQGAMIGGIDLDLGPMALLKVANTKADLSIVVTSERVQCLDQGLFRELDIEPKEQAIVAVKSTVHFRADFEDIASEIILAACPGTHPCNLEIVPYENLRAGLRLGPGSSKVSV